MEPQTPTERMIQEYVPGKQVTLAHLIANPGKDLFKKLGLPDAVSAIGILTITPSEASIIACDIATKSGAVEIGFLDRFTGAVVLTGDVSAVEYALSQVTRTLGELMRFTACPLTRTDANRTHPPRQHLADPGIAWRNPALSENPGHRLDAGRHRYPRGISGKPLPVQCTAHQRLRGRCHRAGTKCRCALVTFFSGVYRPDEPPGHRGDH